MHHLSLFYVLVFVAFIHISIQAGVRAIETNTNSQPKTVTLTATQSPNKTALILRDEALYLWDLSTDQQVPYLSLVENRPQTISSIITKDTNSETVYAIRIPLIKTTVSRNTQFSLATELLKID